MTITGDTLRIFQEARKGVGIEEEEALLSELYKIWEAVGDKQDPQILPLFFGPALKVLDSGWVEGWSYEKALSMRLLTTVLSPVSVLIEPAVLEISTELEGGHLAIRCAILDGLSSNPNMDVVGRFRDSLTKVSGEPPEWLAQTANDILRLL